MKKGYTLTLQAMDGSAVIIRDVENHYTAFGNSVVVITTDGAETYYTNFKEVKR